MAQPSVSGGLVIWHFLRALGKALEENLVLAFVSLGRQAVQFFDPPELVPKLLVGSLLMEEA